VSHARRGRKSTWPRIQLRSCVWIFEGNKPRHENGGDSMERDCISDLHRSVGGHDFFESLASVEAPSARVPSNSWKSRRGGKKSGRWVSPTFPPLILSSSQLQHRGRLLHAWEIVRHHCGGPGPRSLNMVGGSESLLEWTIERLRARGFTNSSWPRKAAR
jgi:hypothetical protein